MPLVPAKCTKCGGELQIDNAHEAAICPYCGTPFIVEKAIHYYTTQNVTSIGNVEHADIHMEDSHGLETRLTNAESYLSVHKDYEKAEELFRAITGDYAGDWRGWWGVLRAMTREFTGIPSSKSHKFQDFSYERTTVEDFWAAVTESLGLGTVQRMAERAFNVMDKDNEAKCRPEWEDYQRRSQAFIYAYADKAAQTFADNKAANDRLWSQVRQLEQEASQLYSQSEESKSNAMNAMSHTSSGAIVRGIVATVITMGIAFSSRVGLLILIWIAALIYTVIVIALMLSAKSGLEEGKRLNEEHDQKLEQANELRRQWAEQMGRHTATYTPEFEPFYKL